LSNGFRLFVRPFGLKTLITAAALFTIAAIVPAVSQFTPFIIYRLIGGFKLVGIGNFTDVY
jgi:hypothetical protein